MVEHLAVLLETFPGAPNQTRCFAHILNLVAKSVLRPFEAPKKGKAVDGKELAAAVNEIEGDGNGASDTGPMKVMTIWTMMLSMMMKMGCQMSRKSGQRKS
jgi:hypothetical protein